jgi:peptidyl-dipeptidase Dcp
MSVSIDDIKIRTELKSGDIGYVVYRHGKIYNDEYAYSLQFESYVAQGFAEFYQNYDSSRDCVWICEHNDKMVGFLLLMHRENKLAQLRFFYLEKEYRGIGLGKKLMGLFVDFLKTHDYIGAYLWTTNELFEGAALYRRHGFLLTEEEDSLNFGKPLKEQKYELIL